MGLLAKNHVFILKVLIWMFDFRPGKSPGFSRNKPQRREPTTNSIKKWVCLWDSSLLHSRHAMLLPGGALRDDTKNGCVADYSDSNSGTCSHNCVIPSPLSPLPPSHKQSFVVSNFLPFFFYRCSSDMYCWEKLPWIVSSEWHQSNWPHQNWLLGVNKRQNMLVFYYL